MQVRQDMNDSDRVQLPIDPDRQAFLRELVDDIQYAELPSVAYAARTDGVAMATGPALDKVVGQDVI
ncbi:hypothetical protein FP2506_15984 [Fulvimarina pelagi HTCC2506]|uniref:Uncharacterized protein n=1 Tax=Fulvimarina pelagi HTCC2506 TaxID=314231 RepID=Q0G383_9HYPH|nr:hypothetical protein FP2506_15984 [Fulvimarina pelagi HTCC2506]